MEKSKATRHVLTEKIVSLKQEKVNIRPEIVKLITATKELQAQVKIVHKLLGLSINPCKLFTRRSRVIYPSATKDAWSHCTEALSLTRLIRKLN